MSMNDPLANGVSAILNREARMKQDVLLKPISKMLLRVLEILKDNLYLGEATVTKDAKGDYATVALLGKINKCNVIRPRYAVQCVDIERFEKRYLPAKDFGVLIISTHQGIMTHHEAKKKGIGGRLISFFY